MNRAHHARDLRHARAAALDHVLNGAPPPECPFDRNTFRARAWAMAARTAQAEAERFKRLFSDVPLRITIME